MATRFSSALFCDNQTDARFRAWVQFIEDTFVATGGWVVTGDTGQMDIATVTHPISLNLKKGYRIYRMNDALQATYPVFMRVDYGGGANAGGNPGIWLTIGTGSDGVGNITGVIWNGATPGAPAVSTQGSSTTQATNCYGSAAPNRITFALFVNSAGITYFLMFGMERTKDASGADTGDGLLLVYGPADAAGGRAGLSTNRYVRYAGGTQPTEEIGLNYITTNNNPSETFSPGDIGLGIVIHFYGLAQQPGLNWLICNDSDVSNEGFITVALYGATHVYQHLNLCQPGKTLVGSSVNDTRARVLMRYD